MARVFLSHSSSDSREAVALKRWLVDAEPGLANEIFLDLDRNTGIRPGVRWKEALKQANERCEAVICLITENWDASHECRAEFRTAEAMNKPIYAVRLQPLAGRDITSEWQRCDMFGDGPKTRIELGTDQPPVEFLTDGLLRLRDALRAAGLAADTFAWPPSDAPDRSPYRGWQVLETVDAAVYFGRDAQIGKALGELRALRTASEDSLFIILGPSGVGKSSFLRAGLLPRLTRDTRHFLPMPIVRPGRHALTGDRGLARSIHTLRSEQGLRSPSLGQIKERIDDVDAVRGWLQEAQRAALQRALGTPGGVPPTVVLPVDQAEELVGADAGDEGSRLLEIVGGLAIDDASASMSTIVALTIRSDRYEPLQTAPALAGSNTRVFDDLRPMPQVQFKEVICGPARRATEAGGRVEFAPELVDQLLADWSSGADTLPLLSLTLARLYHDYGDGIIGLAEYQAMGGMRGVVQTEVDELLDPDPTERRGQLEVLRAAFIPWLATINPDNDQPMRRVAKWFDLPAESHSLLDDFVARRLLLKDERDGEIVIEVALESLLRQWDALAGWLTFHAADLKEADALERASAAWQHNSRSNDWLLGGNRLVDAERLVQNPGSGTGCTRRATTCARPESKRTCASRRRTERHETELRMARERQEAAEALASTEARARTDAEAYADKLRRRTWILRAALALVLVVATVAVFQSIRVSKAGRETFDQYLEGTETARRCFKWVLSSFVDAGCQGWVASRPAPQAPGAEERKRRGSLVAVLTAHRSPPLTV